MSKVRCSISRRYPERPFLGVGAVVLGAAFPDRVLLVQRANEPHKGWWSLPGGLVESGETLRDAIRREVCEETGLAVNPGPIVEVFERILRDGEGQTEHHYVVIDFLCKVMSGELAAGDDATSAAWFWIAELHRVHLTEGALGVIVKALELSRAS